MDKLIKAEFENSGFSIQDEEAVLEKCVTLCNDCQLKPPDLVSSWEVFYLNRQIDQSVVTDAEMEGFIFHVMNEQREATLKQESRLHFYSSNDVETILREHDDTENNPILDSSMATPDSNGSKYLSKQSLKPETPFGQRKSKFMVQYSLNSPQVNSKNIESEGHTEDDVIRRIKPVERCSLVIHGNQPERGCKFMFDSTEDKFNHLEKRILKHTRAFIISGICEESVDPTIASQNTIFSVGMICCDGEGRMNENSVLLQSSTEHSGGQKARLDLHMVNNFSIFPGQVVGIKGNNPSGHCLTVSEILDFLPHSPQYVGDSPLPKKRALDPELQSYSSTKFTELSMIIAAGPFTTSDNLLFEPLTELLAYARRMMPQLLILMGPFIDSEHREINSGVINTTFDQLFEHEVQRRVQEYVDYMGSSARVVLVPSVRDANHDFVFPQPAFDMPPADVKHQIMCATNPAIFEANEVKIGCCTADILKHMSGEEISRSVNKSWEEEGDRRSRLAKHILNQHSFYPLYPPAECVPLDLSLAPQALEIPQEDDALHILILPSDLAHFIKVVQFHGRTEGCNKCVCVNPGRLAKGVSGGTFVELKYYNSNPENPSASVISI